MQVFMRDLGIRISNLDALILDTEWPSVYFIV
jgi:hypothetical protein